jgi:hypothetical protein
VRRSIRRRAALALAALLPALAAACSFSYSSGKFSDSSKGSSNSSTSSSPSGSGQAYRSDVRDYTAAFVKSSADLAAFQAGIGDLARRRGISDWEDDANTWQAIGEGLSRARVSAAALDVYKQRLADGSATRAAAIQKGYDSAS